MIADHDACTSGELSCYCRSGRSRAVVRINESGQMLERYCAGSDASTKLQLSSNQLFRLLQGKPLHMVAVSPLLGPQLRLRYESDFLRERNKFGKVPAQLLHQPAPIPGARDYVGYIFQFSGDYCTSGATKRFEIRALINFQGEWKFIISPRMPDIQITEDEEDPHFSNDDNYSDRLECVSAVLREAHFMSPTLRRPRKARKKGYRRQTKVLVSSPQQVGSRLGLTRFATECDPTWYKNFTVNAVSGPWASSLADGHGLHRTNIKTEERAQIQQQQQQQQELKLVLEACGIEIYSEILIAEQFTVKILQDASKSSANRNWLVENLIEMGLRKDHIQVLLSHLELNQRLLKSKQITESGDISINDEWKSGMTIAARFRAGDAFYPGIIRRANSDGTFDIDYHDGDKESGVSRGLIQALGKSMLSYSAYEATLDCPTRAEAAELPK